MTVPVAPSSGTWLEIPGPDCVLPCWWASPANPRALILVLPGVFGLNAWLRSVAGRLRAEGYAALVLPLFARTAPGLEFAYDAAGLAEGRSQRSQVSVQQFLADAEAVLAWRGQQPLLAALPVGAVGFCFGGHLAWQLATLPALQATCAFYGAGPPLAVAQRIPGRLWAFCGDQDPLMPAPELAAIAEALAAADPPGQRHRYLLAPGAGHGYLCDQRADFHPEAAAEGWRQMCQLFSSMPLP